MPGILNLLHAILIHRAAIGRSKKRLRDVAEGNRVVEVGIIKPLLLIIVMDVEGSRGRVAERKIELIYILPRMNQQRIFGRIHAPDFQGVKRYLLAVGCAVEAHQRQSAVIVGARGIAAPCQRHRHIGRTGHRRNRQKPQPGGPAAKFCYIANQGHISVINIPRRFHNRCAAGNCAPPVRPQIRRGKAVYRESSLSARYRSRANRSQGYKVRRCA